MPIGPCGRWICLRKSACGLALSPPIYGSGLAWPGRVLAAAVELARRANAVCVQNSAVASTESASRLRNWIYADGGWLFGLGRLLATWLCACGPLQDAAERRLQSGSSADRVPCSVSSCVLCPIVARHLAGLGLPWSGRDLVGAGNVWGLVRDVGNVGTVDLLESSGRLVVDELASEWSESGGFVEH